MAYLEPERGGGGGGGGARVAPLLVDLPWLSRGAQGSAPIYQPIGKVLYTNITAVSSKMTKKAHMFA